MTAKLDVHKIIDFCSGLAKPAEFSYTEKQERLAKAFKKYCNTDIRPKSIQKWVERGQIPGDRLIELHLVAEEQGKRLNLYDFILNQKTSHDRVTELFG